MPTQSSSSSNLFTPEQQQLQGKLTLEQLKELAIKYFDACEPQTSWQYLSTALQQQPHDGMLLELAGCVHMDLMNTSLAGVYMSEDDPEAILEKAFQLFMKSVSVAPDVGFEKYLYLGQLSEACDSIEFFKKALVVMEQEMTHGPVRLQQLSKTDDPEMQIQFMNRKRAQTCCSIIEIYMTDCCDDVDAEQHCEQYIQMAQSIDPMNTEVYQMLSSVRLSQNNREKAKEAILKALELWSSLEVNDLSYPTYPVRLSQAKICIECGLYDLALDVLMTVQKENDEDPELWYVYGWCFYMKAGGSDIEQQRIQGDNNTNESILSVLQQQMNAEQLAMFEDAKECLEKVLEINEREVGPEEMVQHTQLLLNELKQICELGKAKGLNTDELLAEEMDADDDDDAWE